MTLPIKERSVLSRGSHEGYEWFTAHNSLGCRCGYVRVPPGHPWYEEGMFDCEPTPDVHGGLSFAEPDTHPGGGTNTGWWLGFDCGHDCDLPDPELPARLKHDDGRSPATHFASVASQQYVEAECRSLCEQAKAAIAGRTTDDD